MWRGYIYKYIVREKYGWGIGRHTPGTPKMQTKAHKMVQNEQGTGAEQAKTGAQMHINIYIIPIIYTIFM